MELPLQAQTLEVLTTNAHNMMIPNTNPWFCTHTQITNNYLKKIDFQSIILNNKTKIPSQITQDNANKLIKNFLYNQFKQYNFPTQLDRINTETFKYNINVDRTRIKTKNIYIHESSNVRKKNKWRKWNFHFRHKLLKF